MPSATIDSLSNSTSNFMAKLLVAEAGVKLNNLASDKALKESLVNLRLVEFTLGP